MWVTTTKVPFSNFLNLSSFLLALLKGYHVFLRYRVSKKTEKTIFEPTTRSGGKIPRHRIMLQPSMCQHWVALDNHHRRIIGYLFSRRFTCSSGCLPDRVYDMVFIGNYYMPTGPASMESSIFGGRCRGSAKYIEILLLCNYVTVDLVQYSLPLNESDRTRYNVSHSFTILLYPV